MSLRLSSFSHVSARVFEVPLDRASRSFVSQVYVWAVFSVSFSVSFFLRSWAGPRRFGSLTWPQLGPILEPCWVFFGTCLGVLLVSQLKIAFKMIFC